MQLALRQKKILEKEADTPQASLEENQFRRLAESLVEANRQSFQKLQEELVAAKVNESKNPSVHFGEPTTTLHHWIGDRDDTATWLYRLVFSEEIPPRPYSFPNQARIRTRGQRPKSSLQRRHVSKIPQLPFQFLVTPINSYLSKHLPLNHSFGKPGQTGTQGPPNRQTMKTRRQHLPTPLERVTIRMIYMISPKVQLIVMLPPPPTFRKANLNYPLWIHLSWSILTMNHETTRIRGTSLQK
ncbi:hypothetical protein K469DRAFT_122936 [Zopfia rhizophila CBS 207.26]|uniref:Uncharacterized protein n=1 Tax=Zopfia rhizophila CBS 207.26 TaxID=1314779 RepID=A0A6A6E7S6_9PEZI|nr:hypothetical protein K469DRAFT_122936 [Zopfia rhizophila CBS 207.26]